MSTVLRRFARSEVALALALLLAVSGAIGPVRAVHPGTDGGLTVPTGDTIRQSPGLAGTYELDIAGADDIAWSPGGRYLAYTVPDGPAPGLYVTDGAGCFTDRLTTNTADRAPAFGGATLYFTRGDSHHSSSVTRSTATHGPALPTRRRAAGRERTSRFR